MSTLQRVDLFCTLSSTGTINTPTTEQHTLQILASIVNNTVGIISSVRTKIVYSRRQEPRLFHGESNQNPRCTQKPISSTVFRHRIRYQLLRSMYRSVNKTAGHFNRCATLCALAGMRSVAFVVIGPNKKNSRRSWFLTFRTFRSAVVESASAISKGAAVTSGCLRRKKKIAWVGVLVVCFLYKINPNPRQNICCGKKWPKRHF